ncbi:hypothetical protein MIR68_006001 [Amoeboaphelidium protococcarum]|nr:hypothetical protein MIR68_006001 [Amoeboaphelidium protococcarum]
MTLQQQQKTFRDFKLDDRLLRALEKQNFTKPTLIQSSVIEIALQGKDIVGKAKTGSGKSLSYILPILHKILQLQQASGRVKSTKAVIIVPSRELAAQVKQQIKQVTTFCNDYVSALNITNDKIQLVMTAIAQEVPDILIGTPKSLLQVAEQLHAQSKPMSESIQHLVIDEADLLLSFGYEKDMKSLQDYLPKIVQTYLMSATLNAEVDLLKSQLLRNPAIIKLEDGADNVSNIQQFIFECEESDKFLYLFYTLKMKLLRGKCLIFANGVDRGYKLKLFLEQFSIKSGVLNAELPENSKLNVIKQFNRGAFDYLIATEEIAAQSTKKIDAEKSQLAHESSVSRGIDFKNVACVCNLDLPQSVKNYTHRIGRTGRGNSRGVALSFITSSDHRVLKKIEYKFKGLIHEFKQLDRKDAENFRYRCDDVMKQVKKKSAVKDARFKELKGELLNNEKLKAHFKENPTDLNAIRHDKPLNVLKAQPQLKHVPEYLMPSSLGKRTAPMSKHEIDKIEFKKRRGGGRPSKKAKIDPLKSLKFKRKSKAA